MALYIRLGFELEMFAPHDFGQIYWYLDYIYGNQQYNLSYLRELDSDRKSLAKG
jgi:hypothetical protein